ncbi:UNVERIFIED_CONTAM: hypothetical protein K2H54_035110 [Gekko kuhli]
MVMRVLQRVAMAAARKGVYWLDEEIEMMLEALVEMEAVDYISSPEETPHVEEEGRRVECISSPGETPHVEEEGERVECISSPGETLLVEEEGERGVEHIIGTVETAHVEEAGDRAVEYISGPGETPHVSEEWDRGRLEVASILAPKGQPTPVVISSAVESEEAEARPSTSQQAPKNDLPGVLHRVEALEKGLNSLKTTVDQVRFNVFFIKTGMKAINQTLTEMRLDLALEHQRREDRGDETEEEDVEEQQEVEVDPEDDKEGNAEDGGSPMQ